MHLLLLLHFALVARAGVYFIQPAQGSSCTGGAPCTLSWLDDGSAPFITDVGVVSAGLYTGKQQLVQAIAPLNVADRHSIEFTPNAQAGPNSASYYIAFISTHETVNGTQYAAFSPFFALDGMSGSFSSPLASATHTFSVPASLTQTGSLSDVTITVGNVDTSLPPSAPTSSAPLTSKSQTSSSHSSSPTSTSSRFTVSPLPPPSSPSGSAAPSITNSSGLSTSGALASQSLSMPILAVLSLCAVVFS